MHRFRVRRAVPPHKRNSYANVVATVALVLALGGGTAWAAHHYLITSAGQIKPSVLKSLKGKHGSSGPPGTTGPTGTAGPTGAAGASDGVIGISIGYTCVQLTMSPLPLVRSHCCAKLRGG